tara:strand:- start:1597 stop:2166 length:570 start_codon:yes stop_codon:yes gene_type:complete
MKIKKLIKILECIEGDYAGKLPRDMYELGTYRGSKGEISIDEMDFVHVMRAFEKIQEEVTRLKKDNDKFYGKYDEGLQVSVSQTNQITKLEQEVSRLRERNVYLQERVEELTPNRQSPVYTFSEIPNDCKGQEFTDNLKKYLNKDRFKMRARGQYLDKSKLSEGESWKTYDRGQPIDKSTHIRVYLDKK